MVRLIRMPQSDPAIPQQMDFIGRRSAVMGTRGMVSSSQPLASEVNTQAWQGKCPLLQCLHHTDLHGTAGWHADLATRRQRS